MSKKRRKFQRAFGELPYRKLFVISAEGARTEPEYFSILNNLLINRQSVIKVKCLKGGPDSSPQGVLKRMKDYLREEGLKSSDEAWLVVDKDAWTDKQLGQLCAWAQTAQTRENYGLALSNPKFEYWLLLHFEDGADIASSRDCGERLKRYLPGYDKGIDRGKITLDMIDEAIRRARLRDTPPCADWPRAPGGTTVYKLVENILKG